MRAKDLTKDHDGIVVRIDHIVVRVDGSVVGEDMVLIREGHHTWSIPADTEMDIIA